MVMKLWQEQIVHLTLFKAPIVHRLKIQAQDPQGWAHISEYGQVV